MVEFSFRHKEQYFLSNIDTSGGLPEEVTGFCIHGPFDSNSSNYEVLTQKLKSSPKIFETIELCGLSEESPEFLAFVILVCNKAKALEIESCPLSTNAMSCLMAAMIACDGIRHLSYRHGSPMPTDQAKILLGAVQRSTCLETFHLGSFEFQDAQAVGRYLIKALQGNQSLEEISLGKSFFTRSRSFLPIVLEASISGSNVKKVSIEDLSIDDDSAVELRFDVLEKLLGRKDCALKELRLRNVALLMDDNRDGSSIQNTSVTTLELTVAYIHGRGGAAHLVSFFKSLERLKLHDMKLENLSFLDPLLFGESTQLKSLDVSHNRIDENKLKQFIEKLRKVKGLQHLAIGNYQHLEESLPSVYTALVEALQKDTDLEFVESIDFEDFPLDLNRGGRRLFVPSGQPFPTSLLPRVLERASKISYYDIQDQWGKPTFESPRTDVVFWMIQRAVPHFVG